MRLSKVKSVRKVRVTAPVFNLTLPEPSNFYAGGVLVHNCKKQYTGWDYIRIILEQDPVAYVRGRFEETVIKLTALGIGEEVWLRTPVDISKAVAVFRETGDLIVSLDVLYHVENQKV